ncbi:MAG: oligopeptidase A [Planctomycetota bacterium]|jgi:oligopeptidase A
MENPLLEISTLPAFSQIEAGHIEPAMDALLQDNRNTLNTLLSEISAFTWDNLVGPLEDKADLLSRAWSPVNHLHSVADNDALRAAYNACLPKLTEYGTEMGQHEGLYRAYTQLKESDTFSSLHMAQQKSIENALRDFHLSGIGLDQGKRDEYKSIRQKLSQLETKFEENLLDATQNWKKHLSDQSELKGLPESALALAAQNAEREKQAGWLLTLEFPSYLPIMQYADNRALREEVYRAFVTRASDQGADAGLWDNGELMVEILSLRQKQAALLGFANYADYSLALKMATDPDEVLDFLKDLVVRSRVVAETDLTELRSFAEKHHQVSDLQAWDIAYYSEKLRIHKFDISQEELRPYFPAPKVIHGMFAVVNRLYGIDIGEIDDVDVWHEDVQFYEIHDASGQLRGSFYLDLYARPKKRGGAWMSECVVRRCRGGKVQSPVAYLTCNFTPPIGNDPSLLTHDEVTTLFHEFGHGLHHMLTLVDYPEVSGINGVPWDAVELPSQFMENWCWERESLSLIARHYRTGVALPDELFVKMLKARSFQSGMQMVRQLEFALFDFRLHHEQRGSTVDDIQALLNDVRSKVAVIRAPEYNRFQHGFTHIFAGGYSAGYYSYKWAEVLSADAFSKFEENGIFDRKTGEQFLKSILEQGGSREPMDLFVEFRGRKPSIEPLLRHSGILPAQIENHT